MTSLVTRALISGTTAAAMATLAAGIAGRFATGSYTAPINATSHITWGEEAARQNKASLKYTGMGALLNYGGSVFWALFYAGLTSRRHTPGRALLHGGIISTAAYITDYHVVPRRFTPGFEKRLPGKLLALIYTAFGVGLCARDLLSAESTLKTKTTRVAHNIHSFLTHKTHPTRH